ncbi:TIGR03862 family flavoprotein [Loktanella sp. SALINAS62]|uniref:TIGR03862 family flavoprotein n=1 Tax=Loktanella sp. SALINAS62 TaxID=2706124 RepID=UPI001B8B7BCD|nr:TIGR03862 family flavoprotein [Loktanella sp. SALINAS62]MBS1302331.1 TIGR03862 family flavoprotein [Loktanella sp. SALINAS62]
MTQTALVIGAGPAGLMAADILSAAGLRVTIADRMPSVGRKFLMAGKSGLNLTKAEDQDRFAARYPHLAPSLSDALQDFGPDAVAQWAANLGQPLFTGTTGRVFPTAMKASPLLRAWLARLDSAGVTRRLRWCWTGWYGDACLFETPDGPQRITADITILAMGGASWRRLGSDGAWADKLRDKTAPFRPANCGFRVDWSPHMAVVTGHPVKATALRAGDIVSRGEWVITAQGVEGGGIYDISHAIARGHRLTVDLVPDLSPPTLTDRLSKVPPKTSLANTLRKTLRLPAVKVALFNECARNMDRTPQAVAQALKSLHVPVAAPLPIDQAISTAGGLRWDTLDGFALRDRPRTYCAGEMLDWDAPTGGYLITACLATGRAAALQALNDSKTLKTT